MPLHVRMKWFLALILSILPLAFYAQDSSQITELKTKLKSKGVTALDSAMIHTAIANQYIYQDLDSATVYIDDVIQGATKGQFILPDTFYNPLLIKAWTHQGRGELNKAKLYMNKAIEKAKNAKKRETQVELIMNYGSLLVQTRDTGILDFVSKELPKVDTTLGKADYVLYTLLHQYESKAYVQQEEYALAIKSLLKISGAKFLKNIPNYKYGIRTGLSECMAYMGDNETAAKQLELALADTLHRHQRKEVYSLLACSQLKVDSLAEADHYITLFAQMTPHTNINKRDLHYLKAGYQNSINEFDTALLHVDSSLYYNQYFEDNQKMLDASLLKASLCEKKKDVFSLEKCISKADSLLANHEHLNTVKNLTEVARVKLLHNLLAPQHTAIAHFNTYEELNSKLVNKKINPQLVAAVLAFDKQEQQYEIDQLLESKEKQSSNIKNQTTKLRMSGGALIFLMGLSCVYGWVSVVRQRRTEELVVATKQAIEDALQEISRLQMHADQERSRIAQETERERKQLLAQQEALENRVDSVESKKQELETKLKLAGEAPKDGNIVFATPTKTYKVKSNEFMYAVAENDGTRIYLKDKHFWLIIPLKGIIKQLSPAQFVRIFRSIVVNIDFIDSVNSKYVVLENGEELAMSRTYRDAVKGKLGRLDK